FAFIIMHIFLDTACLLLFERCIIDDIVEFRHLLDVRCLLKCSSHSKLTLECLFYCLCIDFVPSIEDYRAFFAEAASFAFVSGHGHSSLNDIRDMHGHCSFACSISQAASIASSLEANQRGAWSEPRKNLPSGRVSQ